MAARRKTGRTVMFAAASTILLAIAVLMVVPSINHNRNNTPGDVIDSLDGVYVS